MWAAQQIATMNTVSEISNTEESPFDFFSRDQWDRLADRSPLPLTHTDLSRLASLGDPIDIAEVDAIYRPLTALLQLYVEGHRRVEQERSDFLTRSHRSPVPFIIGIGGSVAVGKSTVARLLRFLLSRWEKTPRVDLITTDGFPHPASNRIHPRGFLLPHLRFTDRRSSQGDVRGDHNLGVGIALVEVGGNFL